MTAALVVLLGWYREQENAVREQLIQLSQKSSEEEKEEVADAAEKAGEEQTNEPKEAVPTETPTPTPEPAAEGIACWGDDLINGNASETYSYMAVLQKTLQENGYELPVVNKTLQGGGTLSMMKMAGVEDSVLQNYITEHKQAAGGKTPYVTETGIRDLTEEETDRSESTYIPVIFMGYYGGWNHDPAELAEQQQYILETFRNQEKFLVVGTRPMDGSVTAEMLDTVLSDIWKEHYISLAETCPYPASTYEAQDAMAKAIFQKMIDLEYIKK